MFLRTINRSEDSADGEKQRSSLQLTQRNGTDDEYKGATICRNARNHSSKDTASHARSVAVVERQISQTQL